MVTRTTPAEAIATAALGFTGGLAGRNPRLLRFAGLFLLRFAERTQRSLLFQEPPRITRWASWPVPLFEILHHRTTFVAVVQYRHGEHDLSRLVRKDQSLPR